MFVDMLGSNSLRLSKLIYDVYFNKYNFLTKQLLPINNLILHKCTGYAITVSCVLCMNKEMSQITKFIKGNPLKMTR